MENAPDEIQREITREREKLAAEMNALAKEFIQRIMIMYWDRVFSLCCAAIFLILSDSLD